MTSTAVPTPIAVTPPSTAPTGADRKTWFRPDIEGLRAVAVLLVVLYHAGVPGVSGGFVGVDVFFVISGYLITSLLLRELVATGSISLIGFYARRFTRLLPAAAVVTVSTLVAAWLWLPQVRFGSIAMDALTTSGYGINYRLAERGIDYLAAAQAPSPFQHYWSLAVEEQFYAVWPLLLLTASGALYASRRIRKRSIAAVLVGAAALSFALSAYQTTTSASWAYFGLQTRAWELAAGALVAVGAERCGRMPRRLAATIGFLGLAAVIFSALVLNVNTPFPGYAAALPVGGAAMIVAAGSASPLALLRTGAMQRIGALSYSWYLWHWPVLIIAPFALGFRPDVWTNCGLLCLSLAAAALTYVVVETPVRTARRLRRRPARAVATGLALSSGLATVSVVGLLMPPRPVTVGDNAPTIVIAAQPSAERQLVGTIESSLDTTALPSNLVPRLDEARADIPLVYADGCQRDLRQVDVKKPCIFGDTRAAQTMVLTGDSHAAQWFPALDAVARQWHMRLISVTKSACQAADVLEDQPVLKRPYTECVQWRHAAWRYIQSLRPAVVVMSASGNGGHLHGDVGDQDQAWVRGWERSVRQVAASGARVVVVEDTPWPTGDVPDCVAARSDDVQACARPRSQAVVEPARRTKVATAVTAAGALLVDPTSWFCAHDVCPPIIGNVLVERDDNHMTATYARTVAPVLAERLGSILGRSVT